MTAPAELNPTKCPEMTHTEGFNRSYIWKGRQPPDPTAVMTVNKTWVMLDLQVIPCVCVILPDWRDQTGVIQTRGIIHICMFLVKGKLNLRLMCFKSVAPLTTIKCRYKHDCGSAWSVMCGGCTAGVKQRQVNNIPQVVPLEDQQQQDTSINVTNLSNFKQITIFV